MKERATMEPTATPNLITTDSLIGATPDVNLFLPQPGSLKRTVQRKRKASTLQSHPDLATANDRTLTDLCIPEYLYQLFKIFDSGPGDDRIIMFTTDSNLALLRESMRFAGDGTFKVSPTLWYQIYTIHAMKNGYTVPCVYARTLVDFEQGAYLTLVDVFPGVEVEGCFFHLCQRLDYHVKELLFP